MLGLILYFFRTDRAMHIQPCTEEFTKKYYCNTIKYTFSILFLFRKSPRAIHFRAEHTNVFCLFVFCLHWRFQDRACSHTMHSQPTVKATVSICAQYIHTSMFANARIHKNTDGIIVYIAMM